jgi:hypothetical protein
MRPRLGTLVAPATVLLVSGAFVLNNLAPYLGLNYAGAMTMYSGLAPAGDNHFFMPKIPLSDADNYVRIVRVAAPNVPTAAARQFEAFGAWARQRQRPVSLNFVRYHASRICRSAPDARVELTLLTPEQERLSFQDVCAEPSMLRYAVLSKYPACEPECKDVLRQWALGKVPAR